jgi:hypothetical protein
MTPPISATLGGVWEGARVGVTLGIGVRVGLGVMLGVGVTVGVRLGVGVGTKVWAGGTIKIWKGVGVGKARGALPQAPASSANASTGELENLIMRCIIARHCAQRPDQVSGNAFECKA